MKNLSASQFSALSVQSSNQRLFVDELYRQIDLFSSLLKKNEIRIEGNRLEAWEHFLSLPLDQQIKIRNIFGRYFEIVMDIQDNGYDFRDTVQSLWRIHCQNKWLLNDEVIQTIASSDVVEIYMKDQTSLFRNFNYYHYTSYSISDLTFYTWPELIEHGEGGAPNLDEIGYNIFVKNSSPKEQYVLPSYIAVEKFSPRRFVAKLTSKSFTAIRSTKTGMNEAVLVVWKIELQNHEKLDGLKNVMSAWT